MENTQISVLLNIYEEQIETITLNYVEIEIDLTYLFQVTKGGSANILLRGCNVAELNKYDYLAVNICARHVRK